MSEFNIYSMFDGISCGQQALFNCGVPYNKYYASEIHKTSIDVTQRRFPKTIQFGNALKIHDYHFMSPIHLLMGGSPCQGFSFAGKRLNFDDPRSKLFFEFVRMKKEISPDYFFLENVKMDKASENIISEYLGVEPVLVNSALVSAQNRERLYWTNIPGFVMPTDLGITIETITGKRSGAIDSNEKEIADQIKLFTKRNIGITFQKNGNIRPYKEKKEGISELTLICHTSNKSNTLIKNHAPKYYTTNPFKIHEMSPLECERLMGLPDNYTKGISKTGRIEALGNGWQVDTIMEFFKHLPK